MGSALFFGLILYIFLFSAYISVGVVFLPIPLIPAHVFEIVFRFPAEFLFRFIRACVARGDIARGGGGIFRRGAVSRKPFQTRGSCRVRCNLFPCPGCRYVLRSSYIFLSRRYVRAQGRLRVYNPSRPFRRECRSRCRIRLFF